MKRSGLLIGLMAGLALACGPETDSEVELAETVDFIESQGLANLDADGTISETETQSNGQTCRHMALYSQVREAGPDYVFESIGFDRYEWPNQDVYHRLYRKDPGEPWRQVGVRRSRLAHWLTVPTGYGDFVYYRTVRRFRVPRDAARGTRFQVRNTTTNSCTGGIERSRIAMIVESDGSLRVYDAEYVIE